MKGTILWLTVVFAGWLVTGCEDDKGSDNHTDPDSGSEVERNSEPGTDSSLGSNANRDSGLVTDSGTPSDASEDSGLVDISDSEDQTPPTGANGLAMDAEGMIWLADLFGNQVLRFDPSSGEILARFEQDAAGPDDIAIDQQGRVFWTGWANGQIGRIDPISEEDVIIAELEEGPNSIAFSEQGRLLVGFVFMNYGLYEVDPKGTTEPRLISDISGSLNAFDFGPDGFLWGPLDGAVVKIDVDTGEVVETIVEGTYCSVRYYEEDNSLYALTSGADKSSPALDRIDLEDYSVSRFSEPALASIDNFIIDSNGNYYVTGFDRPEIAVIGPDGTNKKLLQIGEKGTDSTE